MTLRATNYPSKDSNLTMGLQSFTPMDENNDTVASECIAANENDDTEEAELRQIGLILIRTCLINYVCII